MTSTTDMTEAADRSLAEVLREEARHARGGVVWEQDGLLLCRAAGRLPVNPNAAMRTADGLLPERVVALTTAFFGENRSGFGLQLRLDADHDLADAVSGLNPLASSDCPAMMVEGPLDSPAVDADVRIASGPDDTAAYALVVDDAYQSLGWPAGAPGAVFASPSLLLRPDKAAFVARVDGQPAAAAYVHRTGALGLVSWVGCTVASRGRGLAGAVTIAATNAGFELGASVVWLVASAMGEPLYRRLGYREFARSRSFVLWPGLGEGSSSTT